jgi:hypothetical protein
MLEIDPRSDLGGDKTVNSLLEGNHALPAGR